MDTTNTTDSSPSSGDDPALIAGVFVASFGGPILFVGSALVCTFLGIYLCGCMQKRKLQKQKKKQKRQERLTKTVLTENDILWALAQGLTLQRLHEEIAEGAYSGDAEEGIPMNRLDRLKHVFGKRRDRDELQRLQFYPELLPPEILVLVSHFVEAARQQGGE